MKAIYFSQITVTCNVYIHTICGGGLDDCEMCCNGFVKRLPLRHVGIFGIVILKFTTVIVKVHR